MKKWTLVAIAILVPALALAVTVEGTKYESTVNIEGKTLKLVGAGLREKWLFDVYTMGAYSESGSCNTTQIVKTDEVKYLRLNMHRDVSAEKMASAIGEAFGENMPKNASAELKKQHKAFESYFKKECKEGNVIEFTYVPGKGTSMKQNGSSMGAAFPGKGFQEVLWNIYFSKNTCCDDLKEQILETCKKK